MSDGPQPTGFKSWQLYASHLESDLYDLRAMYKRLEADRLFATEALAQREEELAAERRKNRELSSVIGRARELLRDSAGPFDGACTILAQIPTL